EVGIVGAAMATGLVADTLIKVLKPSAERSAACRAVAVLTAFTFAGAYLIVTEGFYNQPLPFDLTLGLVGITGVVALALTAVAIRESTVEAVALLGLLRGKDAGEVTEAFNPMLSEDELGELCADVADRHRAWAAMPLDQLDVVYLFLEAISLPAPSDSEAEHD